MARNIDFEWSPKKAETNQRKHGVSFEEAASAFEDPIAQVFDDEAHSEEEPRELLIGYSEQSRLLFVAFVQRTPRRIRIISARRATGREQEDYEEKPRFK